MVTYIVDTPEKREELKDYLTPLWESDNIERIVVSDQVGGGSITAPSKRKNYYKLLPPVFHETAFEKFEEI